MADEDEPAAAIAPWQVLDSSYAYRDRWLAVRSDTVRVPNGTILSPYHTIEFPEWVCAVALTPRHEIVLIEEYRHGIGRNSFELPSGAPDDPARTCWRRCSASSPRRRAMPPRNGRPGLATANTARQNNRVHAFLALDARKVAEPEPDAGEIIATHVLPWQRFVDDLAEGRLEIPGPAPRRAVAAQTSSPARATIPA